MKSSRTLTLIAFALSAFTFASQGFAQEFAQVVDSDSTPQEQVTRKTTTCSNADGSMESTIVFTKTSADVGNPPADKPKKDTFIYQSTLKVNGKESLRVREFCVETFTIRPTIRCPHHFTEYMHYEVYPKFVMNKMHSDIEKVMVIAPNKGVVELKHCQRL